ncbi:hypothetical protein AB1Y20_008366 [Prymnesium parvum]|uniref:Uncharacterized protein n=1 Tax=Prymnesium parvum TaxID=97485 RepID=A0AB34IT11_PRYPA
MGLPKSMACEVALRPREEEPSPRLQQQRILTSLDLMPSTHPRLWTVLSCDEAAASMDVEVFGERTEAVREWALHELATRRAPRQSASTSTATVRAHPTVPVPLASEPVPPSSSRRALTVPQPQGCSTALVVVQQRVEDVLDSYAAASVAMYSFALDHYMRKKPLSRRRPATICRWTETAVAAKKPYHPKCDPVRRRLQADDFSMPAGEAFGAVVLIDAVLTVLPAVSHFLGIHQPGVRNRASDALSRQAEGDMSWARTLFCDVTVALPERDVHGKLCHRATV